MEQADIDPSWLGPDEENYTIVEPEFRGVQYLSIKNRCLVFPYKKFCKLWCFFQSQTSSPENPFGKSNMDDFDFVDVEGDMEGDGSRSVNSKKKDVLEEGREDFIKLSLNVYL